MTSCGGMFNVIVRRSTFTSWSTSGIFQTIPGPRGGVSSRPRRNMTPRSYSRMSRLPHGQLEATDGLDLDLLAGDEIRVVVGVGLPELAVDEDEARGSHLSRLADDRLRPDGDRQPAWGEALPEGEAPEERDRAADADDEPRVDAVGRRLILEEECQTEAEGDHSADRERPMGHCVQVDDEQRNAEQHEGDTAPARVQNGEAVQGEHEADAAERAGKHDPRMQHLEDEPDDPGEEEDRDEVWVDDRVEEAREESRLRRVDLRAGEVERVGALGVLRPVALEPVQQRGERRRDEVDDVHVQRL